MTPERYRKFRATLDRRQPDLTLLTEQVHKSRNLAALTRTCDAVGIHQIHIVWPFERHRTYSGTAMGSDRWVEAVKHLNMTDAVRSLQQQGMQIHAAHLSATAMDYRTVDYTRPCAILMGNEKDGVTAEAAELADTHIVVPMLGMVESYNVSVAAGIILAEAQGQRQRAGLYAQQRLSDDEYWRTFFRWAHPDVARFCDERALPYPALNRDDGEIINPSQWYASVRTLAQEQHY